MGISVQNGYKIRQMDVITAFLLGFLDEKIYIIELTMFEGSNMRGCLFKKALYGPKYSFLTLLRQLNFQKTKLDNGLFVSADQTIFIAVYIDDLLLFGLDKVHQIDDVIQNL